MGNKRKVSRRKYLIYFTVLSLAHRITANPCNMVALVLNESEPAHQAITTDLFNGRISRGFQVRINQNNHSLWIVEIHNQNTGRSRRSYFKPRQYGDEDGWSRTPMEYVAYALNRKLGMDYIPPTAYRRWLNIDGRYFGEGAFIYAVQDARLLYDTDSRHWNTDPLGVTSDHRIMCVLLQNQDGHYKNLLLGKHWVDGVDRPVFIDFGASLRVGTQVSMTDYPAFRNSTPVDKIRSATLQRLKQLSWNDLKHLREFISEKEIRGILARRDGIVRYFEKLILERGRTAVLIGL